MQRSSSRRASWGQRGHPAGDGSFAPAKRGGEQVGLTKKGKGTKWMVVADGTGLPLGFHLESANIAEVKLAEETLDSIRVSRPRGRPRRRPEKLVADRAYDSSAFRSALRRRGMRMCILPKRRPAKWRAKRGRPVVARKDDYRLRYTVERSFAWLGIYRRLLIRWEHLFRIYRSFFSVALLLVCLKRLTREQRVSQERTYVGGASPRAVARLGRARRADRGGRRLDAGGFVLADPFETILRSISASYLLSAWARVSDVLAYYHLAPADLSWGWLHPGETLIAGLEQRATPSDYVGWTSRDLKRFDGDSRFRAIDAELAQGQPALRCASSWRSLKWSIAPHDVASGLRLLEALSTDESTDWAPVWILQHAGAGSGAWIEIARALDASDQHALDQALAQAQATYSPVGYKVVLRGFASFIAQPGMSLAIRFPQAPSG